MASDNKSISYLEERERVRKFLLNDPNGKYAVDLLKGEKDADLTKVLDDDKNTNWDGMLNEHRSDLIVSSDCKEHREAAELARQSSSVMAPMGGGRDWLKFFSPPLWYFLRKQIECQDPDYWNDMRNVLREALDNPQWTTQPAVIIRGMYDKVRQKGRKIELTGKPDPIVESFESRSVSSDPVEGKAADAPQLSPGPEEGV